MDGSQKNRAERSREVLNLVDIGLAHCFALGQAPV